MFVSTVEEPKFNKKLSTHWPYIFRILFVLPTVCLILAIPSGALFGNSVKKQCALGNLCPSIKLVVVELIVVPWG